jgi:hypothetical protein
VTNITRNQRDVLEFADRMQRCHGPGCGMFTNRTLRKATAEQCVKLGWLRKDWLRVLDDDGFAKEPERERMGYVLTDSGKQALGEDMAEN